MQVVLIFLICLTEDSWRYQLAVRLWPTET